MEFTFNLNMQQLNNQLEVVSDNSFAVEDANNSGNKKKMKLQKKPTFLSRWT